MRKPQSQRPGKGVTWNSPARRHRPDRGSSTMRGVVAAAALTGLAATIPAAFAAPAPHAAAVVDVSPTQVIIRSSTGNMAAVADLVRAHGGTVDEELAIIAGVAATVPTDAVAALRATPAVHSVTPDASLELHSSHAEDLDEDDDGTLAWVREVTGAADLHELGIDGAGVDVAIVDSGIAKVRGYKESPNVLIGPDVSFEKNNPELAGLDTYGHGTHLAGIINGDDDKDVDDLGDEYGIAPGARLVSIKAADATGNSDVSQVIAAIDWVVQHRKANGLNIRVLNLAFGTDSTQSYMLDPLSYAVEAAWKKGIVVVVAAGNRGEQRVGLDNPATNPYVLAVGASDSNGTLDVADDTVPSWSAVGDGMRNPDVVAPGKSVISFRVKNSFVDERWGDIAKVHKHYFKGSGTSQSSAVVSGLVALMLEAHPTWTPDQVKEALRKTARDLPLAADRVEGEGLVDAVAAIAHTPSATSQVFAAASGTGSLDRARGTADVVVNGTPIEGEKTAFGQAWNAGSWSAGSWSGNNWNGGSWSGGSWSGGSWSAGSWSAGSWSAGSWSGGSWSGGSWSGEEWSAGSWSNAEWNGQNWNSAGWG